jgi:hypothetical protein
VAVLISTSGEFGIIFYEKLLKGKKISWPGAIGLLKNGMREKIMA